MRKRKIWLLAAVLSVYLLMTGCGAAESDGSMDMLRASASQENAAKDEAQDLVDGQAGETANAEFSIEDVEEYTGQAYAVVNGNQPYFSEDELSGQSYEFYSELDELGRCGVAHASIGVDLMPTEKRESISHIKPTGWQSAKYDNVDGKYLYNRCHLIGFQLAGENANEKNLITGTRYLNVDGMLPFENMVADYVKETENHVMYRVTPVFEGNNLVASGVLLEAQSVEDQGEEIEFCVYAYNVQPGIVIDYATGESYAEGSQPVPQEADYILNTNAKKFHDPDCSSVKKMKEENKLPYTGSREDVIAQGYEPCENCNPK